MLDTRAYRFPHPGQIDVDHLLPLRLIHGGQFAVGADAGVAQNDVEPAEDFDALIDRGYHRLQVAHVGDAGDDLPAGLLAESDGFVEVLSGAHVVGGGGDRCAQVGGDDVGAFSGQCDRVATSLTASRAGDERDFTFYSSHYYVLYLAGKRMWKLIQNDLGVSIQMYSLTPL